MDNIAPNSSIMDNVSNETFLSDNSSLNFFNPYLYQLSYERIF